MRVVGRVAVIIAMLAAPLVGASTAHAADDRAVLVLPIEHEGLDPNLVKNLTKITRDRIEKGMSRYKLMPEPALGVSELVVAAGCTAPTRECLVALGKTVAATRVIRIVVGGTAAKATLTLTMVRTKNDRKKPAYTVTIEDLGPDAYEVFGWHIAKAVGGKPPRLMGQIALLTEGGFGTLDGADLMLDDKKVLAKDLESLRPGSYRLEVRQKGFETFIWLGEVRGGRIETVRVKFVPKKAEVATSPPISTGPPPGVLPPPVIGTRPLDEASDTMVFTWVLGGAAVAAGVAGGISTILVKTTESRVNDLKHGCGGIYVDSPACKKGRLYQGLQLPLYVTAGALFLGAVVAFFIERPNGEAQEVETSVSLGLVPRPEGGAAASMLLRF